MEITVTGRHFEVPARFSRHVEEKLAKVPQLDPRVTRAEVVIHHEANPRRAKDAYRIEVTCYARRTIIRAEASADEEHTALDLVMAKLTERLRRVHDRRRVHRGNARLSVAAATSGLVEHLPPPPAEDDEAPLALGEDPDCPVQLREKVHASVPMDVEEALKEMELVGHDFYLYQDRETSRPSLVYRRRGWSYGVIHLDVAEAGLQQVSA